MTLTPGIGYARGVGNEVPEGIRRDQGRPGGLGALPARPKPRLLAFGFASPEHSEIDQEGMRLAEPRILHFDEIPTVARGGGSVSRPLVGAWLGAQGFTSGVTTNPKGRAIPFHSHNVEEGVTLLEGEAICEVNGNSYRLKPWDTTYIPAGIVHRFVNVGNGPMSILWVYATTHVTRTLAETGETTEHMSPGDLGSGK